MKTLINRSNLWETVDNLSGALLTGEKISSADKNTFAKMMVERHKMPNRYANMYALTEGELGGKTKLFTGEAVTSRVSKMHIAGEDSSRVLRLLKSGDAASEKTLAESDKEMSRALSGNTGRRDKFGIFCCYNCGLSVWRNMASGGLKPARAMLSKGMVSLKFFRDGKGRWNGFPYYNTLYTLSLTDLSLSKKELLYTLPLAESLYKKLNAADKYTVRRKLLIEKIMNKL